MSQWDRQPRRETAPSSDLRGFRIFQHFPDAEIAELAGAGIERLVSQGQVIFDEGAPSDDFFVVLAGAAEEHCTTANGLQPVGKERVGQILGETSFLDGRPRPTTAVAVEKGALLHFDGARVRRLLEGRHELGVALARSFWHSLAGKIRQANQLMTGIGPPAGAASADEAQTGQRIDLKPSAKVGLFEETGLSAAELRLLATTLPAKRFASGAYLFREGDAGDCLYVVFEGQVRISRRVAGRGDEPLAVLRRGDVFGEMALVDDQARSADARAHGDSSTVLVLSQADLDAVFHMPPHVASQFLHLVCGVLCHRLRSMVSMLAAWRLRGGAD